MNVVILDILKVVLWYCAMQVSLADGVDLKTGIYTLEKQLDFAVLNSCGITVMM